MRHLRSPGPGHVLLQIVTVAVMLCGWTDSPAHAGTAEALALLQKQHQERRADLVRAVRELASEAATAGNPDRSR